MGSISPFLNCKFSKPGVPLSSECVLKSVPISLGRFLGFIQRGKGGLFDFHVSAVILAGLRPAQGMCAGGGGAPPPSPPPLSRPPSGARRGSHSGKTQVL